MEFSINKFKDIRSKRELTQKEIATLLGVKQNTISTWESGARQPRDFKIAQIAKKLDIDTSEITIREEERNSNLEPLEKMLMKKVKLYSRKEKIFLLGMLPEKYKALQEEIKTYENIIQKIADILTN